MDIKQKMRRFKYRIVGATLLRFDVDETKHLLRKFGNSPAINKDIIDGVSGQVSHIAIETVQGRRFIISLEDFLKYAFQFNFGHEQQLGCRFRHWTEIEEEE